MGDFFKLKERETTVKTEVIAGITTFVATSYVILVNPSLIGGGNQTIFNGVLFATCLGAAIGTLLMAFIANIPFAQAPGMGLSAFFTFTVMPALAVISGNPDLPLVNQYQRALPLVFISGILFILITVCGIREIIINSIPKNIKMALGPGIGLFIAYLGLQNSGLVVGSPSTQVELIKFVGEESNPAASHGAILALLGLFLIAALYFLKVKGGILIGIVVTTVLSFVTGYATIPEGFTFNLGQQASDWVEVSLFKMDFVGLFTGPDLKKVIGSVMALTLSFALVNMFDTIGTLIGAAKSANLIDENGEMKGLGKGMLCDSIGTAAGALLGTSTVTTVVESSAGIGEGGRTGLTSVVTGLLFLVSIALAPFIVLIPHVATAPALIFVGCLMLGGVKDVDFSDMTEALPAFLTIVMMPLTFSIANGISFGLIAYVVLKVFTGQIHKIKIPAAILTALLIVRFFL